jgi:hypothetical protein
VLLALLQQLGYQRGGEVGWWGFLQQFGSFGGQPQPSELPRCSDGRLLNRQQLESTGAATMRHEQLMGFAAQMTPGHCVV